MSNKPSFKQAQVAFAAHIRNPQIHPMPADIENRRMDIYKNLFINSISGLLGGSFPVIRSLYDKTSWHALVRQFFKKEHNKTPHFPEIPREFVDFLQAHDADASKPFLYELAHYEWIEMHLDKHNLEITQNSQVQAADLLNHIPVVSPLAKIQAYHYPVHQIKTSFQPQEALPNPLFMLIWRNLDYQVKFSELNPFSALLLETLMNNESQSGEQVLANMAQENQHPDPKQFIQFGSQALIQWYEMGIILNTT